MYSFEKISSSLVCQICDFIYKQPVKLSCGKSICKSHLFDLNGSLLTEFYCKFCQSAHHIPSKGLHPNFFIQNQINTFQHECDLKSKIAQSIENLKVSYEEIEEVEQEYLPEHFQDIEFQIMEYKEILLKNIEHITDEMLKETRNRQTEIRSKLTQLKISKEKDLNQLKTDTEIEFRRVKCNKTKLETDLCNINNNALNLNKQLIDLIQNDLKPFTFLNKLKPIADERVRNILIGIYPEKENLKIISCYKDGSIVFRDLLKEESKLEFFNDKHETDVNCILLSPDNQKLISGDKNGTIKVWDVKTGELLRTVCNVTSDGEKRGIKCMINSSTRQNEILIASKSSSICILDLNSYNFTLSLRAHAGRINCLEFLTHEILLSSSSDLTIKIWNLDLTRNNSLQTIECPQKQPMILRKINESTFACLFCDCLIKIFSSDKESILFKCYKTITVTNSSYLRDLKVCSDINLLIFASKVIHLYSLSDFTCVGTLWQNADSFALSMSILPNNRLIAANNNNTLEIWCLKTCQSLRVCKDNSSLVNKMLFYNN
jgi:WD40 repeat protein